jgi:hypothetical protein
VTVHPAPSDARRLRKTDTGRHPVSGTAEVTSTPDHPGADACATRHAAVHDTVHTFFRVP